MVAEVSIMNSIMGGGGATNGGTPRVLARSIVTDGPATIVRGGSPGDGGPTRRLAAEPDLESARRWLRTLRRIDRVEIDGAGPATRCLAHTVGHRRPVVQPVALATALGLGVLGVPLLIDMGRG